MATPRDEGGAGGGEGGELSAEEGYVPGMVGGASAMKTAGEPELPASRGYRGGMTDEDETDKASPEVLSSEAALPLANTKTPWKLDGGGGAGDGSRSGGNEKSGYTPGDGEGKKIDGGDSTRTGGPQVMKGLSS